MTSSTLRLLFTPLLFSLALVAAQAQLIKPESYYWTSKPEDIKPDSAFAEASAVVLKDMRIYNFFYDKGDQGELQLVNTVHKIIQINDTRAIESYNKIYIPIGNVIDISDIRARTVSASGKVTELNKDNIKELNNKEGEGAYKIFAVEGLEKGSRLEYYYKLKKVVDYAFRTTIGGTVPVQFQQVHIICPENLRYIYKTYNGTSEVIDTLVDERRFVVLTSRNVIGREEEKYSAYNAELMRHEVQLAYNSVVGKGRILSYNSLVQRMYPTLYETDPKAAKRITKLSEQLGLSKLTPEDKIRHIENYIKTTIQKVGASGEQYLDVNRILQDRIANNNGTIRLYMHLFNANGIRCEVVYTTDRSQIPFDPDFESWNFLDETILFFPDQGGFLDPSAIAMRYPMIPTGYELNHGLFMEELVVGSFKNATGTVKQITATDVSRNGEVMDIHCRFNKDLDSVYLTQSRSFIGILAPSYRFSWHYSDPDTRKKITDEILTNSMTDGKVLRGELQNQDLLDSEKPLIASGVTAGTSLLEKTGNEVIFKIGDVIGPQTELYEDKDRQSPVDMFYAHYYTRTIKVEIPAGYQFTGLEALKINIRFDHDGKEACGFVSDYKIEGNMLTVTANEYYNVFQLPKEQFENFRKVINAAADFNKVNIVLQKAG